VNRWLTALLRGGRRGSDGEWSSVALEAARGKFLIEESPEIVLVLDDGDAIITASRRAREFLGGLGPGDQVPADLLSEEARRVPVVVPYQVDGRGERLVYLSSHEGELGAYEELRAGFTAAVSHELRTPLARLLVLLETAELPGADATEVIAQARAEVGEIRELIDDVLFLSELETGQEVVSLGTTKACPVLESTAKAARDRAARAGVVVTVDCDPSVELPVRPRMLRVLVENLVENAIRYAGEGATLELRAARTATGSLLEAADDGPGVEDDDLPRLFERFYRADRARSSRGTGLGLAIVKHIVGAAGGTATASRTAGGGLTIRCTFPA
jgi:two-component system phosphate regulon sensor histidine kinase PhoR